MTKSSIFLLALLAFHSCSGQSTTPAGARFDSVAQVNNGGQLHIIANPAITVCANGSTVSNCAQNPVVTYTDATLSTPCPTSTPIVLNQTSTCVALGDADGNFGFWVAPQQTYSYLLTGAGATPKIYSFTAGGGGTSGGTTPITSVTCSPATITFGTVQTGVSSSDQPFTCSNTGNQPVVFGALTFTGSSDFHAEDPNFCNGAQIAGATCVYSIYYRPTSAGAAPSSSAVAHTSAPANPLSNLVASLSGTGSASPSSLLSLTGFGTGSGTVTDGGTLNCHFSNGQGLGVCSLNYTNGSTVTLTATADPGSAFSSFAGATCTTSPCTITISAAALVTATFDLSTVTRMLNISGVGQGTGTVTSDVNDVLTGTPISCTTTAGVLSGKCSATFNQSTVVTLTESPAGSGTGTCSGAVCTFTTWGGASGCTTASTCAFTVNNNSTVTATFAAPAAGAPLQLQGTIPGGCGTVPNCATNAVSGTFSEATAAGDTYAIYGLWNDNTTTVTTLTDTKGNTYTQFPTCSPKTTTGLTLVAYYAANVVAASAGSNTVTFALNANPSSKYIEGLHYSGLTTSPFDSCAGATGSGTAINSGNLTTANAGELLTAGTHVAFHITTVGSGYTQQILVSGNDAETEVAGVAGTYSNQPTHSNAQPWADILGAFIPSGGGTATNYSFNVLCAGAGTGTVTASGINVTCTNGAPSGTASTTVAANGTLTLTATPATGSAFTSYSGAGCGGTPTCTTQAITTNTIITANFSLAGNSNYYVRTDGSDSNNGLANTAGGAFRTIQKCSNALNLGPNGTTCNVAAGTYAECLVTNRTGTVTQRIRYVSTTPLGAKVICDGSSNPSGQLSIWSNGSGSNTRTADYVDIVGFEITATTPSNRCMGIVSMGAFGLIQGNWIHDILGTGNTTCQGGGGAGIDFFNNGNAPTVAHDSIAENNIIDHIGGGNSGDGTSCANVHGIYIASPRQTARNNLISRACGWAIHMFHDTYQDVIANNTLIHNYNGGILVSASDGFTNGNTSVFNNIVANNGGNESGIEERYGATNSTNVYRNNLLWGNTPQAFNLSLGARTVTGNRCAVAETNCQTVVTANNTNVFVSYTGNAKTSNLQLLTGSPAIDQGATGVCAASPGITPCIPSLDFLSVTRPQRAAYDIGAYEIP